ncbi:MAG: hypothetical protein WCB68_20305 [Pyrinomonadaceae bacterium]
MEEQRYTLTKLSLKEFSNELDELWSQFQNQNSELSQEAQKEGIDLGPLRNLKRDEAIAIERTESGLDVTAIVMAFVAHGIVEVVKAAWLHLLLPKIKQNLGEDSIKPE